MTAGSQRVVRSLWRPTFSMRRRRKREVRKAPPRIETRTKAVRAEVLNAVGCAGAALAYVPETAVPPNRPPPRAPLEGRFAPGRVGE